MDETQVELEVLFDKFNKANGLSKRLDSSFLDPDIQVWLDSIKKVGQKWINNWANSRQTKTKGTMPYVHLDFVESMKIDAFAYEADGYGFIGIDVGLILLLNDFFNRLLSSCDILENIGNPSVETNSSAPLPYLTIGLNSYIMLYEKGLLPEKIIPKDETRRKYATILFQLAIRFIVAHELAHIRNGHCQFKNSQGRKSFISELSLSKHSINNLTQQALEMDADAWATVQGMTILKGLNDQINNMPISWDKYSNPVVGGMFTWIIAVYSYFRLSDQELSEVGDICTSHPHQAVRQSMVMSTIYSYLEREFDEKELEYYFEILPDCIKEIEKAISILTHNEIDTRTIEKALGLRGRRNLDLILNQWKTVIRPQLETLTYAIDLVP
ncbi:MAG: hypothetical protein JW976_15415 [Syntrophaceae bacterium]|nr:hypothetical protein [Syntrophaceae bacterium]